MKENTHKLHTGLAFCALCFCFLFFQNVVFSQNVKIDDIIKESFQTADAQKIETYFCENVSLEIQKQSGSFNKQHAINLLKNFFSKQDAVSFSITNSGKVNKSEVYFIIGKFTSKTQSFRVYILYYIEAEKEKIHSLSITNL